jgi:DNA/RNA-binding domain of Phe-tRNA-synthetase-like protein
MAELRFNVTPEVCALGIKGIYFTIAGIKNAPGHPELARLRLELKESLQRQYTEDFLAHDEVLVGFRELHAKVGRSNRKYPSAPEALVKLFLRTQVIPSVNLAVDLGNCISLKTRLAFGFHDTAKISGDVTLRLTNGTERFVPLGGHSPEPVSAGEYCYCDGQNDVLCRLEYKQVEKTKVTLETSSIFVIIQGHARTAVDSLAEAAAETIELLHRCCGGTLEQRWDVL